MDTTRHTSIVVRKDDRSKGTPAVESSLMPDKWLIRLEELYEAACDRNGTNLVLVHGEPNELTRLRWSWTANSCDLESSRRAVWF